MISIPSVLPRRCARARTSPRGAPPPRGAGPTRRGDPHARAAPLGPPAPSKAPQRAPGAHAGDVAGDVGRHHRRPGERRAHPAAASSPGQGAYTAHRVLQAATQGLYWTAGVFAWAAPPAIRRAGPRARGDSGHAHVVLSILHAIAMGGLLATGLLQSRSGPQPRSRRCLPGRCSGSHAVLGLDRHRPQHRRRHRHPRVLRPPRALRRAGPVGTLRARAALGDVDVVGDRLGGFGRNDPICRVRPQPGRYR